MENILHPGTPCIVWFNSGATLDAVVIHATENLVVVKLDGGVRMSFSRETWRDGALSAQLQFVN